MKSEQGDDRCENDTLVSRERSVFDDEAMGNLLVGEWDQLGK